MPYPYSLLKILLFFVYKRSFEMGFKYCISLRKTELAEQWTFSVLIFTQHSDN